MIRIERLNNREEAELQDAADRFVNTCDGDVMKALKTMMLLNRDLQEKLDRTKPLAPTPPAPPRPVSPRPAAKPAQQKQFMF